MTTPASANIFDSAATTRLRRDLQNPTEEGIREVAKQFESLFVQIMLKSMRQATPGDGMFSSSEMDQYRDLHDQQLSMSMSRGQGIGIADLVERQLREQSGLDDPRHAAGGKSLADYQRLPSAVAPSKEGAAADAPAKADGGGKSGPAASVTRAGLGGKGEGWDDPEQFVRDIWPAAERAARRIGADPRALVAQAALETGWGQHVMRRADGSSANNLFGIKAHNSWDGDTVRVPTLEYRSGVPGREIAEFRAYDSLEESFRDYLDFLERNPRYKQALEVSADPVAYTNALQDAGYATDPAYARKIQQIMGGSIMRAAMPALKPASQGPITS